MMNEQITFFEGGTQFKITKPLRLITLFSGYDSQALALKYLGVPFEHYKTCEWAVPSIQALKDLHFGDDTTDYSATLSDLEIVDFLDGRISTDYNTPMTRAQIMRKSEKWRRTVYNNMKASRNVGSIVKATADDLHIVDTGKYDYLLTYSFPCFPKNSLVLTDNGYKHICDVSVGDFVLTHTNEYKKVIASRYMGCKETLLIKGMGADKIIATPNHRFYVRTKYREGHKAVRHFHEPIWKQAKDLTKNDYLGIAINKESIIPEWNGIDIEWKDGRKTRHENRLSRLMGDNKFWWLIGRWFADGWYGNNRVEFAIGRNKAQQFVQTVNDLFSVNISTAEACDRIVICSKELQRFLEQFGKGALNKRLTGTIFNLPISLLKSFVDGYWSGDGCEINGVYKATSISKELIYGMAQCVAKVYKTPYRIYFFERPKTTIIEGRTVKQNNTYQLVFKKEKKKQDKAFYEDGYIWYPIKAISPYGNEEVFDIEVEENHSFTVQNTIVHNCQDLSVAGKGGGMARGSGTRSGMLWEVERLLGECKELPQVLVMENVPEVIGAKNIKHFSEWVAVLDELGYKSKWQVLNGTDFNVPQNRKRCFMVSVLGDYYYTFPRKQGCKLRLKDVLESDVDEKYYLSNSLINCFMEHTRKRKEKGNCFEWNVSTGDNIGSCVTTRAGWCPQDNYIAMGVNLDTSDSFRKAPMVEKVRTLLASKSNCGGG